MAHQEHCPQPGESLDEFRDRFQAQINEKIAAHGHAVVTIFGDAPETTWTYSVGLQETGWPELIVTSINPRTGMMMINEVVARLRKLERTPEAMMEVTEALAVPVYLRPVSWNAIYRCFKVAMERANRKGLPSESVTALQIVWPDEQGLIPGQPGYNDTHFPQPILENE